MSQETWEILCEMEADDVELQLALQCAPLITGLKISNLLTISPEGFTQVGRIVEGSVLSLYPLLETEEKMVILLYREDRLEKYLKMPQVQKLLREAGYEPIDWRIFCRYFAIVMKPMQREGSRSPTNWDCC